MDIPLEKLIFKKSVIALSASDISSFALPLLDRYKIDHFSYSRTYPGLKGYCLTTHPQFSDLFNIERLYENAFGSSIELYVDGFYLWDIFFRSTEIGRAIFENLNIKYGATIIRNHYPEYCEFYHFGSTYDSLLINHFFINNLDILEGFMCLFQESLSDWIAYANKNQIIYPVAIPDQVFLRQEEYINVASDTDFCMHFGFTKKEFECACYVKNGLQVKSIADRMHISPRTVEKHIASLKKKTGTRSAPQLIIFLNRLIK